MDPESVIPTLPAELYASLFHQAADAMFVADSEGRVVAVNPRSCDLLGFTADEMIGRLFTDFADPDELRENPGRIDELRAGRSVVSERRLLGKDGRLVSAETTMRILPDGHLLGVARDITERKRAEEALETANARLEALWSVSFLSEASPKEVADHILGSIVRMTRSPYGFYGFINADESVMTIHAWSGEAMQDCSLVDKPVEFLIRDAGVWGEAVRRRSPLVINDYAAAHDGKKGLPAGHVPLTRLLAVPFFSHGRITVVAAAANRPTDYSQEDVVQMTSFLGSVETITARVRAEEARRRSETLLNVTQHLAGLGGWEWDLETQTMAWTAETYRLHGVEPGEIAPGATGHIELSAECYPPEARSAVLEAFHRCVEQGTPYDLEVPFVDLKGRRMWVRTRAEAVRRGDRIVKVIGDIMDVTGRRGAEEAAAASHQRLLTVLDASANGIYVADPETYEVLFANRALEEIFGSPGQRRCYEYLQHRDSPCPFCTNDRIFGEDYGKILRWEFRNEATGRWFECVDRAITWPDGRVVRYEMAIDIHERKLAEEALRASEARLAESNQLLSGVLQHTHMMAVFLDAGFNFVWVNRAYADTCRQEPGFFPGRNHFDLFPDAENQAIFQRAVDTGEPCTVAAKPFEFPDQPERGVTYWDWSLVPVKDEGGMVAGLVFTLVEVTEQVRATEALRESERRFSNVLESMSLIGVMLDTEGRITFCNDYLLKLTGWTRDEVLGQSWFERFVPPDIRAGIQNEVFLRNVMAGEVPVHFENEIVTRQDERRLVAWNNTILRDPAGQVTGTASVGEDVTDRRRAEESRLEMERRLLHSQKLESLGVLAGGIAHDFNNLLMAILGNLELGLRDLSPASPTRPRLDAASHAARRAADLTRQMLAYSGRGKFLIGRVDLNELVEENVHLLRTSIPRTVTLNLNLDRALPAVEADAGQFQQVIMNLITNAAEAIGGEPGVVTLSTGVRDCDGSYLGRSCLDERPPAGRYVYVEVADTGCGMDEETQKRMFEPFFTTKFTGRGLGLPAVFGIVRGHGGAILLDSAVGRGTTIRVLFPASGGAPAAAETAPAAVVEAAPGAGRGTILIVDDEEMVLQPCAAMVEYMGFTVLTAADGEEAVEMVRRHGASIRAIILDLTMPKLDGAAALERILLIEPGAQVILSSGYDEAEATGRVAKGQLAGFIRKPYYLEQLRTTLERVLGTAL